MAAPQWGRRRRFPWRGVSPRGGVVSTGSPWTPGAAGHLSSEGAGETSGPTPRRLVRRRVTGGICLGRALLGLGPDDRRDRRDAGVRLRRSRAHPARTDAARVGDLVGGL